MTTPHKNRARTQVTLAGGKAGYDSSWEAQTLSVGFNRRVEMVYADAVYAYTKTHTGASDEGDPNASAPPADEIWDLAGYSGLNGYLEITGAGDVDVELWALDRTASKWFYVGRVDDVATLTEFRFANAVRNRTIWLRIVDLTGTITNTVLRATPE